MPENKEDKKLNTPTSQSDLEQCVMREYSQGVCQDGAAILCDGEQLTIEQILARLHILEDVRAMIYDAPELNMNNFDDVEVKLLNDSMCEMWQVIEANA
ncbi:hypothetical protein KAR91_49400 [Candidatus Pacearchaeota archaeon]|nr:hypothetical protein [Candidatus Pacearchaeota archaeon]